MRGGQPVYYAFANGHDKPPIEGSLSTVELALGLRLSAVPSAKPALRDFDVTVTCSGLHLKPAGLAISAFSGSN